MNIRHIKFLRNKSVIGKIIRLPLRLIPATKVMTVMSGSLKGKKWIKGSHNISVVLGTYERKQSAEFAQFCKDSKTFLDLGAHVGYYTLLYHFNSSNGKIYAFEPSEVNAKLFRKHMELNGVGEYKLFEAAVSDKEGVLSFKKTSTTVAGKLDEEGESKVNVVKLSKLIADGTIAMPDLIKMDIEGAEINVLRDLKDILTNKKPVMFVSTHGKQVHLGCVDLLKEMGYQLKPLDKPQMEAAREILAYR